MHHVCPDCHGTGDGKRDPVEGTLTCARCKGTGYGPPVIDAGPGAAAANAVSIALQLLRGGDPNMPLGMLGARVAELLAPVPDLILRQQTYIERLEGANSALHVQFADEQRERELLVEAMGNALGELGEYFRQANQLRGRGTPRSVARIATDNTPRFVEAGR